ncbi:hypothetical protein GG344DRAFT_69603 [Lentinula edodes]|nr:hypothetical protein GG344DRAFT_69603 [Lentinula edodes]
MPLQRQNPIFAVNPEFLDLGVILTTQKASFTMQDLLQINCSLCDMWTWLWTLSMCFMLPPQAAASLFAVPKCMWFKSSDSLGLSTPEHETLNEFSRHSNCKTWVRIGLKRARSRLELEGSYGNRDRGRE